MPPYILKLKTDVPVMVIRDVLHPQLDNGTIFVVRRVTRRVTYVSKVGLSSEPTDTHMLHRIDIQFQLSDVKVTRSQFPLRLALNAIVHKTRG